LGSPGQQRGVQFNSASKSLVRVLLQLAIAGRPQGVQTKSKSLAWLPLHSASADVQFLEEKSKCPYLSLVFRQFFWIMRHSLKVTSMLTDIARIGTLPDAVRPNLVRTLVYGSLCLSIVLISFIDLHPLLGRTALPELFHPMLFSFDSHLRIWFKVFVY
jgi:hypothetical protein